MGTLVEGEEGNRDKRDQKKNHGKRRTRDRKQMRRGVDAMEGGHELCLCDMIYNKEPGGEKGINGRTAGDVTNTCR